MSSAIVPLGSPRQQSLEVDSRPRSFSNTAASIGKCLFVAGSTIAASGAVVMTAAQVSSAIHQRALSSATTNLIGTETNFRHILDTCVKLGARLWQGLCQTGEIHASFQYTSDCPVVQENFVEILDDVARESKECGEGICSSLEPGCNAYEEHLPLVRAHRDISAAKQQLQKVMDRQNWYDAATIAAAALIAGGSSMMLAGAAFKRVANRDQANNLAQAPAEPQV